MAEPRSASFSQKRHYEPARNSRAEPLRVTAISSSGRCRSGSSCPYGEVFTVDIPEPELRQAAHTGYRLKLFARTGPEGLVSIPRSQIADLLARIDADRGRASGSRTSQ
jgi:hypothetical protein